MNHANELISHRAKQEIQLASLLETGVQIFPLTKTYRNKNGARNLIKQNYKFAGLILATNHAFS